jgi:hypothetical protein
MFNSRFRTTFSPVTPPQKNVYKPSLYDICLEYGIKTLNSSLFIFLNKYKTNQKIFPPKLTVASKSLNGLFS